MKNLIILLSFVSVSSWAAGTEVYGPTGYIYLKDGSAEQVRNVRQQNLIEKIYDLGSLTPQAIRELGPDIARIRPEAFILIHDKELRALTDDQWKVLTQAQIDKLVGSGTKRLNKDQFDKIKALNPSINIPPNAVDMNRREYNPTGADAAVPVRAAIAAGGQNGGGTATPTGSIRPAPTGGTAIAGAGGGSVIVAAAADTQPGVIVPAEPVAPVVTARSLVATASESEKTAIMTVSQNVLQDFDTSSCKWSEDLPRRTVTIPTCVKNKPVKVCAGYVVCNHLTLANLKFVRQATCRQEKCSDEKVAECVNESFDKSSNIDDTKPQVSEEMRRFLVSPKTTLPPTTP